MSKEWRVWVWKEISRHGAAWTPTYLAPDDVLKGNGGAYHRGRIWLNKRLEGRSDEKAIEVIHHEIFHLKIERARALPAKLGRMRMGAATALAVEVMDAAFLSGPRLELIRHYAVADPAGFDEECLVQMCCAVMFGEPINLPPRLRATCEALCAPYSSRIKFWGGRVGTLPSCLHGVQEWPQDQPLPGERLPEAIGWSAKY